MLSYYESHTHFSFPWLSCPVSEIGMMMLHLPGARLSDEVRPLLLPELPVGWGASGQQRALVQKAAGGWSQEGRDR